MLEASMIDRKTDLRKIWIIKFQKNISVKLTRPTNFYSSMYRLDTLILTMVGSGSIL